MDWKNDLTHLMLMIVYHSTVKNIRFKIQNIVIDQQYEMLILNYTKCNFQNLAAHLQGHSIMTSP